MTQLERRQQYDRRCKCGVMRSPMYGRCKGCGSKVLQAENLHGLPTEVLRSVLAKTNRWGNPVADRVEHGDTLYWLRPWPIVVELLRRLRRAPSP